VKYYQDFPWQVLWCCWLGGRKGIWPVKLSGEIQTWLSVWSEAKMICMYGPADATATSSSHAPVKSRTVLRRPNIDSSNDVFSFLQNEPVNHSSVRSVGCLFHVHDVTTEEALSSIRWHVHSMTRLPHKEAPSADCAGISATGVSKSEVGWLVRI